MDIEISVTITAPDGTAHTDRIAAFSKGIEAAGDIGLSIEEGKAVLLGIQRKVVAAQCEAFCIKHARCTCCDRKLRGKGRRQIRYRTVFGDIAVESPRFYSCQCHNGPAKTFSPLNELLLDHIAPELLWLETKWASLVSFGVTTNLLKDVLPIDMRLNPDTIRRHLGRVATRMEAELSGERYSFIETTTGARRAVPLPGGNTIELTIPAGVNDGQILRIRGKGQPGFGGGPAGDAYVNIGVRPHPFFTRDGSDIENELPITIDEAVLGAKVEVPTISGRVSVTVPKGASSGRRLRLMGRGIKTANGATGDQYVRPKIVPPDGIDAEMEKLAQGWRDTASHDPRENLWRST